MDENHATTTGSQNPPKRNHQFKDITGQIFGRLTVRQLAYVNEKGQTYWLCDCDCGGTITAYKGNIQRGLTRSCGCLRRETKTGNTFAGTHGASSHPLYHTWHRMMRRCYDPHNKDYPNYGGRGITVCERWHDVTRFLLDMPPKPTPTAELDRKDNDGPYSPDNCRWATRQQQARNKRTNLQITYQGQTKTLIEWCEILNLRYPAILLRITRRKWSVERAFSTPLPQLSRKKE